MKRAGKIMTAATVVAAGAGVAVAAKKLSDSAKQKTVNEKEWGQQRSGTGTHAHLVGGGLASMACAAFLIRDCGMDGEAIIIYEGMGILGGSNDGIGTSEEGFVCRGGRMLNEETYENFWDLFSSIPSIDQPGRSVTEEILNFDHAHPTCAKARLVDKDGQILNVKSMGFSNSDRLALSRLLATPEEKLDDKTIEEWFEGTPHFFNTNFWHMWQTTFAFQRWSSLFEFKRYMKRMLFEFSRIETLEGVTRTAFNQYDSVILPLKVFLEKQGVTFITGCTVTDIDFADSDEIQAVAMRTVSSDGEEAVIALDESDLCIMTNGCMTDCATLGDFETAPEIIVENPISAQLWARVADKNPAFGNPDPFFGNPDESNWMSFTVTSKGNRLLKLIENFSGNVPGSGALMTFKDSGWKMSIVVAAQPHFRNQPLDQTIFWGYGLYTDHIGDYVKKPMRECSGKELLTELICQLHMEDQMEAVMEDVVNVIPCFMPYVDAQFQPRRMMDRPPVVPENSRNFAMISQFVEIPEDMVFTEEYSVRAARIAAYTLMGSDLEICPVTPYHKDPRVLAKALKKSFS